VSYAWEVLIQAAFYLTPIIYPLTRISHVHIRELILMNPMAQAIQNARYVTVTKEAVTIHSEFGNYWMGLIPIVITVAVFVIGSRYFRSQSRSFAENL
jgi:ABC-2 type transport system permease protein